MPSSTHRTRTILPDTRREPLLSRARREPEAFAEFYAEHRHHVLGFFARRTLDPETAVDLVAETFAAAFAALPSFRGESSDLFVGVGYHTASGHLAVSIRKRTDGHLQLTLVLGLRAVRFPARPPGSLRSALERDVTARDLSVGKASDA